MTGKWRPRLPRPSAFWTPHSAPKPPPPQQVWLGASGQRQGGPGCQPGPATFSWFWGLRQTRRAPRKPTATPETA